MNVYESKKCFWERVIPSSSCWLMDVAHQSAFCVIEVENGAESAGDT